MTLDIDLDDAIDGFEKSVKGIDNEQINICVRNGMNTSNYVHIVKNKGMPVRKEGKIVSRGDLLVKFNVHLK